MTIDTKVRVGILLASAAISVFTALAVTHGIAGFLDVIGGTAP